MKSLFLVLLTSLFAFQSFSQTKVAVEDVSKYVGQKVTVCSKVYGTKFLEQSKTKPTFINVGAAYPNSPLTVVIFGSSRAAFKPTPEELYEGKDICVTGEIKEFKGKFQIEVTKPEEIVVQ